MYLRHSMPWERVLALGAHTDDVELGCGAFLSRLARLGVQIRVAAFSRAEESLPAGAPRDALETEFRRSMSHLALSGEDLHVGAIPVRRFPEHRQQILEALVAMNREYDPDLILTMSSGDTHQDHQVVHHESVRAFRGKTMFGYEIPWNQYESILRTWVEVSQEDVDRKAAMLAEYASQSLLSRAYMTGDYTSSAARFRGVQGRMEYAEAFEVIAQTWRLP